MPSVRSHIKSRSILNRYLLILIALATACAPYRKNPLSGSFHDLTAHYNAYFIANEHIKAIELSIFESQDWNYNKVLPIFAQFDSVKSASFKTELEDCIQKASLAIQRHPGSKWEDDSYVLVGKARHYGLEFTDAIETYKYVNTHSENDNVRHHALTELIKTFTEYKEYNNAAAVVDYLQKEKLSNANRRRLHLNTAYLHQKREDSDKMVFHLAKAEELLKSADKARINFIIGRTYHELGFESEAFRYYRNVLRNNPNYDLEFYSKLYMAQVTELSKTNDLKKIQKYFKGLLKDPKNEEYQDKIYYEMAGFELKNGNTEAAIENYKLSVEKSQNNPRQKGYSYWSLGKIYYDSLKDFVLAKNYYDSTVSTMPKDEEGYTAIKKRQEILADFVEQVITIHKNDSLLHLSTLSEDSLLSMASTIITEKREVAKKQKEREKQAAINRARNISQSSGDNIISTESSDSWYFTNTNLIERGKSEFLKQWGDRELEDNWRRSRKAISISSSTTASNEDLPAAENVSEATGDEQELTVEAEAKKMLATVPRSEEEKNKLLLEVEVAFYNLGNIYNLRLEEDENAIESFEELLSRFPNTEYESEVLYQLFLIYKKIDQEKSVSYGSLLQQKFPESLYAKLVENPNYREESFAISEQLKALYKDLYSKYKDRKYGEVLYATDSALSIHFDNEFSDNIALLRVLTIGQTEEDHKYQFELGEFLKEYPDSELHEYAKSLLTTSETFQQERYNSAKARFIKDFNQQHLFIIVYDLKANISESLSDKVDTYLEEQKLKSLRTGNLILDEEKSMLLLNIFPGKKSATQFLDSFLSDVSIKEDFKGQKLDIFIITQDNFDIFYTTKDVDAYLNFYERNY